MLVDHISYISTQGCQPEEVEPENQSEKNLPTYTTASQDNILSTGLKLANEVSMRNGRSNLNLEILNNRPAMVVQNEEVTNYSYVLSKSELELRNLVISHSEGYYKAGIFTYSRENTSIPWKKFEGRITVESIDGEAVMQLFAKQSTARSNTYWCEVTTWHIGYVDSSTNEFVETYTEIEIGACWYEWEPINIGTGAGGGGASGGHFSGGGAPNIGVNDNLGCESENCEEEDLETMCNADPLTHWVEGECLCQYGKDDTGNCLSEEDAWENTKIKLTEQFKNDPCLMKIWNAILESDAAFDLLKGFLGEYPSAELVIGALTSYQELYDNKMIGAYGAARNYHQEQIVLLNMVALNESSSLLIATIIGHELIHASMFLELYENTTLIQDNQYDLNQVQENLPILYELWMEHRGIEQAHHEMIANDFQPFMDQFLREIDISINGTTKYEHLYGDLFWVGLESTQAYSSAVNNQLINENVFQQIRYGEKTKGKCE